MAPHSATVRGTMSNPKTKEAKNKPSNRTQLGDPGSLKAEASDTNPVPNRTNQDGGNKPEAARAPGGGLPGDLHRTNASRQPHSARVRGTMSNPKTADKICTNDAGEARAKTGEKNEQQPRSMLGDPGSLRTEKSDKEIMGDDRGAGPPADEDEMKNVAKKRKDAEVKGAYSKL